MKDIERYKKILINRLKPNRYKHSIAVYEKAMELAVIYKVDLEKLVVAALLHDYAKNFSNDDLIRIAKEEQIDIDEVTKLDPSLLHGPVGAALIKKDLKIYDLEILEAVASHTTGRVGMTTISKIVFLSDAIEVNREYPEVENIRNLAKIDLDKAVIASLNSTIGFVVSRNKLIHLDSIKTRNWLLATEKLGGF